MEISDIIGCMQASKWAKSGKSYVNYFKLAKLERHCWFLKAITVVQI